MKGKQRGKDLCASSIDRVMVSGRWRNSKDINSGYAGRVVSLHSLHDYVGRHHNSTNFKPAAFQPKSARGKLARQHCPLLVDKKKQVSGPWDVKRSVISLVNTDDSGSVILTTTGGGVCVPWQCQSQPVSTAVVYRSYSRLTKNCTGQFLAGNLLYRTRNPYTK
jgi:hypothetical protein